MTSAIIPGCRFARLRQSSRISSSGAIAHAKDLTRRWSEPRTGLVPSFFCFALLIDRSRGRSSYSR